MTASRLQRFCRTFSTLLVCGRRDGLMARFGPDIALPERPFPRVFQMLFAKPDRRRPNYLFICRISATTSGLARVEISPASSLFEMAARTRRMILPERVFGMSGTITTWLGRAIAPISRTTPELPFHLPDLRDDFGIGQGRDIAGVFVVRDGREDTAHDLAGTRLRHVRHDHDMAGASNSANLADDARTTFSSAGSPRRLRDWPASRYRRRLRCSRWPRGHGA